MSTTALKYARMGKCNRCGFCCVGGDKDEPCEHLDWKGEMAVCRIYAERPTACRTFPDAPPILTKDCGYYFVDTWAERVLGAKEI